MPARPDIADRVHGLRVRVYRYAGRQTVQDTQLVRVHDEFFV